MLKLQICIYSFPARLTETDIVKVGPDGTVKEFHRSILCTLRIACLQFNEEFTVTMG